MSPPRYMLFPNYEKTSSSSNGEQLRQRSAPGTFQPRLRSRRGRLSRARARGSALGSFSLFHFSCSLLERAFCLHFPGLSLTLPHLFSKALFLHTLFNTHPQKFLRTVLPRFFPSLSLRAPVLRNQLFFPCSSRTRYLQILSTSIRALCAGLQ